MAETEAAMKQAHEMQERLEHLLGRVLCGVCEGGEGVLAALPSQLARSDTLQTQKHKKALPVAITRVSWHGLLYSGCIEEVLLLPDDNIRRVSIDAFQMINKTRHVQVVQPSSCVGDRGSGAIDADKEVAVQWFQSRERTTDVPIAVAHKIQ